MSDAHPNTNGSRNNGGNGTVHHHRHDWDGGWGWGWYYWPSWYDYQANADALAYQQWNNAAMLQAQSNLLRQQQFEINRLRQAQVPASEPKAEVQRREVPQRVSTPVVPATREESAAAKYKLAMLLAKDGKTADAAEFCTDIVRKYPGTPGADLAQAFLDKNSQTK